MRSSKAPGKTFSLTGEKVAELKYGENPQQQGWIYKTGDNPLGATRYTEIDGRPIGYVNYTDIDRGKILLNRIAALFELNYSSVPRIAIGLKHGNPCGVGIDFMSETGAVKKMVRGDPLAIFGGTVMTNFAGAEEVVEALAYEGMEEKSSGGKRQRVLGTIAMPSIEAGADRLLRRKDGRERILINPALANLGVKTYEKGFLYRPLTDAILVQTPPPLLKLNDPSIVWHGLYPNESILMDVLLGIAICGTSDSNTITIVCRGMLFGNGVGQQDRKKATQLALERARAGRRKLHQAVAVSDSFFPFPDGPELLVRAGIRWIFATSGSDRDNLTQELCREHGVNLGQIPDTKGRMFYGH